MNCFGVASADMISISSHDIEKYRKVLCRMKLKKSEAVAMSIMTNEAIYGITDATIKKIIPYVKKAIRQGPGNYKTNSKPAKLFVDAHELVKKFFSQAYMMDIKMMPSRAEPLIEKWLEMTADEDAARSKKLRAVEAEKEIPVDKKVETKAEKASKRNAKPPMKKTKQANLVKAEKAREMAEPVFKTMDPAEKLRGKTKMAKPLEMEPSASKKVKSKKVKFDLDVKEPVYADAKKISMNQAHSSKIPNQKMVIELRETNTKDRLWSNRDEELKKLVKSTMMKNQQAKIRRERYLRLNQATIHMNPTNRTVSYWIEYNKGSKNHSAEIFI